jgi:hypothetical protein
MATNDRNDAYEGTILNTEGTPRTVYENRTAIGTYATSGYSAPEEIAAGDRRSEKPIVVTP